MTTMAIVVIQGIVLYSAIVPKRDRTRLPAEAARVFRSDGVLEEQLQQGAAFLDGHILEADREVPVDVQAFPACLRMCTDDRVLGFPMRRLTAQDFHRSQSVRAGIVVVRANAIDVPGAVDRRKSVEQMLHSRR